MKRLFLLPLLALVILALPSHAQAAHTATITYTASPDSTTAAPGTVMIKRAIGACPATGTGTLNWTVVAASAPPSGVFTDPLPGPGTYCYYLQFSVNGATSVPSSTGGGSANPFPPVLGNVVVQ